MTTKERIELQSQIVSFAYRKFIHYVKKMKSTYHAYDETFENQKIYHMEDDLWTHTLLVLQQAVINEESDYIDLLTAFCHDFGKMTCGEYRDEKKTVVFPLHAPRGVQLTVDFLVEFQKEYDWLNDSDIELIVQLVSKHIEFVNTKFSDMYLFCNKSKIVMIHSSRLAINDNFGRVVRDIPERIQSVVDIHDEFNKKAIEEFDKQYQTPYYLDGGKPIVTFVCGCSNIGKDTFSSKSGRRIHSLDKERVSIYLEKHPESKDLDSKTLYSLAFKYCNENKDVNLYERHYNSIINDIKNNWDHINICNTFVHSTHRMKLVNYLRNIFKDSIVIDCLFLVSNSNRILTNAKNNSEKYIPENVLYKFMDYQNIPTLLEGFNNVRVKLLK